MIWDEKFAFTSACQWLRREELPSSLVWDTVCLEELPWFLCNTPLPLEGHTIHFSCCLTQANKTWPFARTKIWQQWLVPFLAVCLAAWEHTASVIDGLVWSGCDLHPCKSPHRELSSITGCRTGPFTGYTRNLCCCHFSLNISIASSCPERQ